MTIASCGEDGVDADTRQPVSNAANCKATNTDPLAATVFMIIKRMIDGVNMDRFADRS